MKNSRAENVNHLYLFLTIILFCAVLFAFPHNAEADETEGSEAETEIAVTYMAQDGYFIVDGAAKSQMFKYYPAGSGFDDTVTPESNTDQLIFSGWYSEINGKGEKYTQDTVLDQPTYTAYAYWRLNMDKIEGLEIDQEYPFELETGYRYYSFTPDETAVYELVTWDAVTEGPQAFLRIYDQDRNLIASGNGIDDDGNCSVSHELTAGTTYIFELSEYTLQPITFNFKVHRPETGMVTFHANLPDGQAWFDGDPSKTEKEIELMQGHDIHHYIDSGLQVDPSSLFTFSGWSRDKGAEFPDEELIVDGNIDIYAVYEELVSITLDANGGIFKNGENRIERRFSPTSPFYFDDLEPTVGDESKSFSGWASSPDAAEPDIEEYLITCGEMPEVVYAVYGDAITVTFDADGGYFFYDHSKTIYQVTRGKGHIFYGLSVMHEDPNIDSFGWKDQYGNEILRENGSSTDPNYRTFEDTTFKPIWAKYFIADGNGGYFQWNREQTDLGVWFRLDKPFSNQNLLAMNIFPMNDDSLLYFAGWATKDTAEEPDITEGEADVGTLPHRIFAVWKEDSYYLDQGEGSSWEKGSEEGLEFIVKRTGDDTETFHTFTGIKIDGVDVPTAEAFKATDKNDESLYLTFKPSYLETLEAGSHSLTIIFNNNMSREVTVSAEFTVTEAEVHEYDEAGFCIHCGKFIFEDVTGPKSIQYVSWAYKNKIVTGTGENAFSPDDSCSRIQFVMMLWKMNGSPKVKGTNPFSDVTGTKKINALLWALDEGIINSGKKFNPNGDISRSQIVMMLWKMAGSPKVSGVENPFTDVTGGRLTKAVLWAYSNGIVKGTSSTTFSPDDPCSRIQLVAMLYKQNN